MAVPDNCMTAFPISQILIVSHINSCITQQTMLVHGGPLQLKRHNAAPHLTTISMIRSCSSSGSCPKCESMGMCCPSAALAAATRCERRMASTKIAMQLSCRCSRSFLTRNLAALRLRYYRRCKVPVEVTHVYRCEAARAVLTKIV